MESPVPEAAQEGTPDHFFENVTALNEQMACRRKPPVKWAWCCATWPVLMPTAKRGSGWRLSGLIIRWPHCSGDNLFAVESRWYRDNPLVIRGPGAGRDVTAGAIQSDLNRLAQLL